MEAGRSGFAGRAMSCAAAFGAATVVLLLWAAGVGAVKTFDFCPPGSEAGQCANPVVIGSLRGLAIDFTSGRLYVADRNNNRIEVFEEDGAFLFAFGWGVDTGAAKLEKCTTASTCQAGIAGSGAGQIDHAGRVAVDNTGGSHAIYVPEDKNHRVQKFGPEGELLGSVGSSGEGEGQLTSNIFAGVGPGGVLYVLDNPPVAELKFKHRLQRFKANLEPIAPQCVAFEGGKASGFAVEAGGSFWVSNILNNKGVHKFSAACAPLSGAIDAGLETNYLAIDAGGTLFSEQRESREGPGSGQEITAYNSEGAHLRRFSYGLIPEPGGNSPEGLAIGEDGIFLSMGVVEIGVRRLTYPAPTSALPPPGPIAAPPAEVKNVGSTKATAAAEVNPEGKATQVHAEYLTEAQYKAQGESFEGPDTKSTTAVPLGAEGFTLKGIEIPIGCPNPAKEAIEPGNECLTPETKYRFQVAGVNANGDGEAAPGSFETTESLSFGETYATGVGTDTARLHGEVNPHNIPAGGYFEYVDDASFQESGFAGATKAPDVEAGQKELDFGSGEALVERSISVYPLTPGALYHYRLVASNPLIEPRTGEAQTIRTFSPPTPEPCPANESSRSGAGAFLPDCRAYEMVSPLDKGGGGIQVLKTQLQAPAVLEQSASSGDGLAYGSVRAFGGAAAGPFTTQYIAQRIAGGEWRTHAISPPEEESFFAAIGRFDTEFKFFSSDLCDAWLASYAEPPLGEGAVSGYSNLYRRSDRACGPESYEALAPLSESPGVSTPNLTMEVQGVSGDGRHAIFRTRGKLAAGGSAGVNQLYESVRGEGLRFVCILPGGAPLSGACSAGSGALGSDNRSSSTSGAISQDGRRIFWSDANAGAAKLYVRIDGVETVAVSEAAETEAGSSGSFFWGASANGNIALFSTGGRLYEFDVEGKTTELLGEETIGVVGMSDDGSRVYFASSKALGGANSEGDEASEGKPNVYLYEAGGGSPSTSFVATLAPVDLTGGVNGPLQREPWLRSSRVSPDGTHAAFTSLAQLSDYENKDPVSGEAVKEVYLYDADAKKLLCASCDPSGARPVSFQEEGTRYAARIPGFETQMHAAQVLSEDGKRLYFESADPLTPRDSNGHVDVYQWEAPGSGCSTASPRYSPQDEGCVDLISSGQGLSDARFVEATPSGSDVFFTTLASLLPQDYGLVDIYDARAGGGLPVPPEEEPPCEADSCHHPPPPPVQPTPSSSDYTAPPQAAWPPPVRPCAKGRRRVTGKGGSRCVLRHPSHRKKQRKGGRR